MERFLLENPRIQDCRMMGLWLWGGTWLQAPAPPDLMLQALQSLPFLAVCDMGAWWPEDCLRGARSAARWGRLSASVQEDSSDCSYPDGISGRRDTSAQVCFPRTCACVRVYEAREGSDCCLTLLPVPCRTSIRGTLLACPLLVPSQGGGTP